jgi:hypothetical protein
MINYDGHGEDGGGGDGGDDDGHEYDDDNDQIENWHGMKS